MTSNSSSDSRRIGFLLNHDELHQVAHIAPIISALQRQAPGTRVEVITSSDRQAEAVRQFLDPALPAPVFRSIRPNRWSRLAENMLGRMVPLNRMSSLKRSTDLYRHFDPLLSPWFRFRESILDYFASQNDYNLIFAPHVMLFQRKILASVEHRLVRFRQRIDSRYDRLGHMHVDTGSARSVDMTYTRVADIYLGDVSSQIYEFIQNPRPAIFLNSHGAEWRGNANYEHWTFGPMLDDIAELGATLEAVSPLSDSCRKAQARAFAYSFDMDTRKSPSQRAAAAIAEFMDLP